MKNSGIMMSMSENTDPRLDALDGIIMNLCETPADQDDDFLAAVANKASQIKGLADVEVLLRAINDESERYGLGDEG